MKDHNHSISTYMATIALIAFIYPTLASASASITKNECLIENATADKCPCDSFLSTTPRGHACFAPQDSQIGHHQLRTSLGNTYQCSNSMYSVSLTNNDGWHFIREYVDTTQYIYTCKRAYCKASCI